MQLKLSLGSAALLVATIATVMNPVEAAPSSAQDLAKCLKPLGSKAITSSSSNYNKERYAFDLRYDYKPQVIVMATSTSDVQTAVKCAKDNGYPITPRSGGHSFEGYCVGGGNGAVVVDLAGLGDVKVDSKSGRATVGGGVRLGKLYLELYKQGGYTINAGTCPSVGIGGHALGGGFGLLSRKKGLLIDSIVEMEMVTADGKVLTVSPTNENKDLFYALRGAGGGSYGVVTSFTVVPFKPASKVTSFTYDWSIKDYAKVLRAYIDFQASASTDLGVEMNVGPDGLELYGIYQGPKKDLANALNGFLGKAPKSSSNDVRESTQIEAQLRFAFISGDPKDIEALALNSPYKPGDSRYTKGKSLVYSKPLKDSTIALLGKWGAKKPKGSTANYIIVDLWGGAVKTPANPSAFIHRDAHSVFEFVSEWDENPNAKPGKADCADCLKWMNDMYKEFLADYKTYGTPVRGYQNYIDIDIPNWKDAYYGDALPRLQQIKSQFDPSNVFRFPQSIPLK
ncbi:hypothetical protein B0O80DRAFT_496574 [Mortierella sp. GBAus27b]|nr:hypothetical protein BGX31_006952 [Mortierella sp. GBA43]KAI8356829.1 hypothetical protein B0O80DRAFT_496574 [Mortierella sp. GBAus27b]